MSTYLNVDQKRGQPTNAGSWVAYENGAPEANLGDNPSERHAHLRSLGLPVYPGPYVTFEDADDDTVRAWAGMMNHNPDFQVWAKDWSSVELLHLEGITPARALEFSRAGIDATTVYMQPGAFSPAEAHAFSIESGLSERRVGDWMTHNLARATQPNLLVSAEVAGAYGEEFYPDEVACHIRDGVNAQTARGIRGLPTTPGGRG